MSWLYDTSHTLVACFLQPMLNKLCCRQAEMADKDNCRMLTEIPVKDWIGCPATVSSLSALVGAIVPGQLRKLETVFEVVGLQVLGISSVKTEMDVWLIDSCVKCKKAAPCEAGRPTFVVVFFFASVVKNLLTPPKIYALLAVRLIPRTAPRSASLSGSRSQIATASAPPCFTTNWCCEQPPVWIACYPTRCTILTALSRFGVTTACLREVKNCSEQCFDDYFFLNAKFLICVHNL